MHPRYPAPATSFLFSEDRKIGLWRMYTDSYALTSIHREITDPITQHEMIKQLNAHPTPSPDQVTDAEKTTGHDLVAFLAVYTADMPNALKRHIHYGLTSSDIVEGANFYMMSSHAMMMSPLISGLIKEMSRFADMETYRVGRTHGQIAAPTSWNHQMAVYSGILLDLAGEFGKFLPLVKSPGPTGASMDLYDRSQWVAHRLGAVAVRGTQVIPRDHQLRWATLYLRLAGVLENLALLVRLGSRAEVREVAEGAAANRVGSSAMPHKRNPIGSEKVSGLARVARGYFSTLAEGTALWEDRDLSNSSMERIAVVDLAAVVEHMLNTMTDVFKDLVLDHSHMRGHLKQVAPWTHLAQKLLQRHAAIGPIESSKIIRTLVTGHENQHWKFLAQRGFTWVEHAHDEKVAKAWHEEFCAAVEEILGT